MEKNKQPVSNFLLSRSKVFEFILVAIILSVGISIGSSSIAMLKGFEPVFGLYFGGVICILSLLYISKKIFFKRKEYYSYKGFFILDEIENRIVNIPEYDLSENIFSYFNNALLENKDMEYLWNNKKLNLQENLKEPEPHSMDIIREAFEYYLLDKLSTHLTDYFSYPLQKEKNITVFQREDIPEILMKNRFLDLFSKPMKERAIFQEIIEKVEGETEEDWYILDVDGGSYRKFNLVLPSKSKVFRTNENEIEIITHKFDIKMKINFDGCNTVLPTGFYEHYLSIYGFENYLANVAYSVEFIFQINFKIGSFFSTFGWEDYNWIDSFLNSFDKSVTEESFFDKINWSTTSTLLKCLRR